MCSCSEPWASTLGLCRSSRTVHPPCRPPNSVLNQNLGHWCPLQNPSKCCPLGASEVHCCHARWVCSALSGLEEHIRGVLCTAFSASSPRMDVARLAALEKIRASPAPAVVPRKYEGRTKWSEIKAWTLTLDCAAILSSATGVLQSHTDFSPAPPPPYLYGEQQKLRASLPTAWRHASTKYRVH